MKSLINIAHLILLSGMLQQSAYAVDISFVGNGGDGYMINGQVYVGDLVMGGKELYENPWIGQDPRSSADSFSLEHPLNTVHFPIELLVQKLNDLDQFWLGFGQFVMETIRAHRWTFVDYKLSTTCDANNNFFDLKSSGVEHVQIANRYNGEIRIQRQLWSKMNEVQKVALIVHEGVYSLLKKDLALEDGVDSCGLSMNKARKIMRQIFSPNKLGWYSFDQETIQLFNINSNIPPCLKRFSQSALNIFDASGRHRYLTVDFSGFLEPGYDSEKFIQNEISKICRKILKAEELPSVYRIGAVRKPYRLKMSPDGVELELRSNYISRESVTWSDSYQCVSILSELIPWFMDTREHRYFEKSQADTLVEPQFELLQRKCIIPSLGGVELIY